MLIMDKDFFAGKNILITGLGRFGGGVDAAKFAASCNAKVTVTDIASKDALAESIDKLNDFDNIEFHLNGHEKKDFENCDIVIVNPAVPLDNEFIEIARQNDKIITSQIEIFFEFCPAKLIGITGSIGKSTTAALTFHLLKAATENSRYEIRDTRYENIFLSGNIGNQPLLTILDKIGPDDLVVLELSSFQIEQLAQSRKAPEVALLTNLAPNHLDRYGSFDAYCAAKQNIFRYQRLDTDTPAVSIFNAADKIASEWFEKYSKESGRICIRFCCDDIDSEIKESFSLPGRANLSNLAAAVAITRHFGLDDELIKKNLPRFKALPHRLEFVAEINGVKWYNDSKATTPQATIAALDAFEQPAILIAGGCDKHISFDELGQKIAQTAKAVILFGQTAQKIASLVRNAKMSLRAKRSNLSERDTRYDSRDTRIDIVKSLADAVDTACKIAQPCDVVLLSPACASYDMFQNYQHRGSEFRQLLYKANA